MHSMIIRIVPAGTGRHLAAALGWVVALLFAVPAVATAQIMVAPPLVLMDDANRVTHYLVQNVGTEPQEVTIDFRFGFPATDEVGLPRMEYDDLEAAARHSVAESVRAFPRQFRLDPGQRQRVRIMLFGDREFEDGGHWARIVTSAVPVSPPVQQVGEGVSAQITIRRNTITALMYRRGAATTGIEVEDLSAEIADGQLSVAARLRRTGNTPFLGRRIITVRDGSGRVVHDDRGDVAVYFDQFRRFDVGLPGDLAGEHSVELSFEAARSDVPASALLPIESAAASTIVFAPTP
jgi:hypothetical protein